MRKQIKKAVAIALALSMSVSLAAVAVPETKTTAATAEEIEADLASFDDVSAADIAEALSPAWNLGNTMEANDKKKINGVWYNFPNETAWSNPKVTKEIFEAVRDAGFKSVRIPTSYLAYVGDAESGYKIDEAWMNRVEEVVRMALDTGLYVNINVHGDGYYTVQDSWLLCGEDASKQVEIKAKYKAVWEQIAERFADCDEHLIFESMNEEFDGKNGFPNESTHEAYQNIVDYNQIFVDTVRKSGGNNAKRWLMVCGWNTNIDATVSDTLGFKLPTDTYRDAEIPEDETRVMVTVHYYSPWQFCGLETDEYTQWGKYAIDKSKVWQDGGEEYMESQFKALEDTFTSKGIPVYIGEYGAIDKTKADPTNDAYRAYFMKTLCQLCKDTGCVPVYWDQGYNGNYAFYLFDRNTFEITKPALVDAIMDVYDGDDTPKTEADITRVYLTETSKTLYLGKENESLKLQAVFDPVEVEDTVIWQSDDETVAEVSDTGVVTPVGVGECEIAAISTNGTQGTCAIKVVKSATSAVLNESDLKLECDSKEKKQLSVTLQPSDAEDTVTWSSSNATIAKVDKYGLVTAVSKGTCTITATLGNGMTAVCNVKVYSASNPDVEQKDDTQQKQPATPTPQPKETVKTGDVVKVSGQKLKVTSTKSKTVAYQAPKSSKAASVTIPATVKVLGKTYKVTTIAANAFKNNKKVKSITIGKNVKTIGKNAFSGATKLKKITIKSTGIKSVGSKALKGVYKKCKIYVPKAKYAKYKKLLKGKGQKKTVKIIKK
ncbi:MAG: cellulase family glycosylhydrolase [bacterium]|nr:cellulase family glycosylhydrolase [bacterium]